LLLADGKSDDAIGATLVLLRLAHHFDRNPTLIGYLLAITFRNMALEAASVAMQTGPVSDGVRRQLDAELAVQEQMDGYAWAIKSERVFGIDTIDSDQDHNSWPISRARRNCEKSDYLDMMQDSLASASGDRVSRDGGSNTRLPGPILWSGNGLAAQIEVLAIEATHNAVKRTQAMIRCLRVLNALQSHTTAGSKRLPKLSELGLPIATTTDPFTGKALHVKKTPHGWLVYSVGPNLQDDGGKLEDPKTGDVGVGPPPPAAKPDAPAR
jgi:hypothetical protein